MTPGCYQLYLRVDHPVTVTVGRLGTFRFPAGRYVYTGSALNGLEARIARHRRRRKRRHWHIDYLLEHARITKVRCFPTSRRRECSLNTAQLGRRTARVVAPRFGSSDCRCPTHLVYLGP